MNLLDEAWMPVRRRSGVRDRIAPSQLSDPDLVAFDAERADFNGALAQFAIGLLQTATPIDNVIEWRRGLATPPDAATLCNWFAPFESAFEFEGHGARFMQDFDLRADDGEAVGIGSLLIETPGENAIKNNSDLFIKRGKVQCLCPYCAAIALFTLQLNAPAGGAGHRTGLRGGGPLTTLLIADGAGPSSLWQTLWLNVCHREAFTASFGDSAKTAPHFLFPWLASITEIQKDGGQVTPVQVHPAHVFWAMPRRIRLDLEAVSSGVCDMCATHSNQRIERYVTRNYGLNYKGMWTHPLSPYYEAKEGMLPLHPQPDGLGYKHWLSWTLGMQSEKRKVVRATAVDQFLTNPVEQRTGIGLRLWAFGYDMDNMKVRCWYESTMPLYALSACSASSQRELRDDVGAWLDGADLVASYLRGAVKDAWFGGDARGDFAFVTAAYWSRTEEGFYALLGARIQAATDDSQSVDRHAASEGWMAHLGKAAIHMFDGEWVGTGQVERTNPARIAAAHNQLRANLQGPKLRMALHLPVRDKSSKGLLRVEPDANKAE